MRMDNRIMTLLVSHGLANYGRLENFWPRNLTTESDLLNCVSETFPDIFEAYSQTPEYSNQVEALEMAADPATRANALHAISWAILSDPTLGLREWLQEFDREQVRDDDNDI